MNKGLLQKDIKVNSPFERYNSGPVELSAGFFTFAYKKQRPVKKIFIFPMLILLACNTERTFKKAEDAQDAGREFIRASLDGDYEKAQFYLLQDSVNRLLMDKWEKGFDQFDAPTRQQYKEASILPINIQSMNDSVTTYTFSNSYRKDTTTIKIVRIEGEWLVDLKEILNTKK
jgi:hypothetical protein